MTIHRFAITSTGSAIRATVKRTSIAATSVAIGTISGPRQIAAPASQTAAHAIIAIRMRRDGDRRTAATPSPARIAAAIA